MGSFNQCTFLGRLGADPELRHVRSGDALCSFRLAVSEVRTDGEGQRSESTLWLGVAVFGRQAEACAKHLSKGCQALVTGRLQVREYQGNDGGTRTAIEVVASSVVFVGSRGEDSGPVSMRTQTPSPAVTRSAAAEAPHGSRQRSSSTFADDPIPF